RPAQRFADGQGAQPVLELIAADADAGNLMAWPGVEGMAALAAGAAVATDLVESDAGGLVRLGKLELVGPPNFCRVVQRSRRRKIGGQSGWRFRICRGDGCGRRWLRSGRGGRRGRWACRGGRGDGPV